MDNYKEYINKLKKHEEPVDYNKMYSKIEEKASKNTLFAISNPRLAFGTITLAIVLSLSFYYYPFNQSHDKDLLSYILEQDINGNNHYNLVNYVLNE